MNSFPLERADLEGEPFEGGDEGVVEAAVAASPSRWPQGKVPACPRLTLRWVVEQPESRPLAYLKQGANLMSTSVWWKVLDEGLLRKNQKGDQVEWNLVLIPSPHRGGVPNPSPAGGLLELSGFLVEGMSSSSLGRKSLQSLSDLQTQTGQRERILRE